ncbi:hypothetical protein RM543_12370 [Roseicyclus sp. F158]|uniref:Uncharacterized protein n=1 Tax=Tropicimonas omnivorans TaxID=3075590 RepID=A0ABU3DIE0_9RHOB|nr:hypothetical protein [Roseicyclus sp. F158]MDT0683483.1 hypothetical protein [Roseicyclus sp. F158]
MPDRKRSQDGTRETEEFTTDLPTPSEQGRAQGELERKVATRDEEKQALKGGGASRVTKSDEKGEGGLGGLHGTGEEE